MRTVTAFVVAMAAWFIAAPARAHFQELIPSADIVSRISGEMVQGALMWVRTTDMK